MKKCPQRILTCSETRRPCWRQLSSSTPQEAINQFQSVYFNNRLVAHDKASRTMVIKITSISCRWRTRTTRCITTNVLQTKVDAQRDKLATELSWQRLRRFPVIASYLSKVANAFDASVDVTFIIIIIILFVLHQTTQHMTANANEQDQKACLLYTSDAADE